MKKLTKEDTMKKFSTMAMILALFITLGQTIYIGAGLHVVQAPKTIYSALLHAPAFMFWKLALYGRVLTGGQKTGWIRTARNEEKSKIRRNQK